MAGQRDDENAPERPQKDAGRRARLERALRTNLLKRKAKNRDRKPPKPPSKEGGQGRG
jgi:hypothetical protein